MSCDDLRIGGTLSSGGISGGLSINSTALAVADWSGLLGHTGLSYTPFGVSGRPGSFLAGDGLGRSRLPILSMNITKWGPTGVGSLVSPTADEQLKANTDTLLSYLADPAGNYYEVDMPDGTSRFIEAWALDPASIQQRVRRAIGIPLYGPWPYWWEGGTESSKVVSGTDTVVTGGNVAVYDPVLVFAGNGSFTDTTQGWTLTITGSASAVTVDLGNRTVIQAGVPAPGLLTRTNKDWGWFGVGTDSVTSTVSVTATWRDQWQ